LELFQKAYAHHVAEQVKEMKIRKFFSGVVRPETRKNSVDSRVYIGHNSNPVHGLCSWKHALALVWRRNVFLEAVAMHDYGALNAGASTHVVTSHGGCGAQLGVEPKLITASSDENVSAPSLSVDCRGLGNQGGNPSHVVVAMTTSCHEAYFTYESFRAAARESAQGEDASLPAVCAVSNMFCDRVLEESLPVLRSVLGQHTPSGETRKLLLRIFGDDIEMKAWVTAQGGSFLRLSAIQLKAFLKLDARVNCITGPARSWKTEIALMHAALAYNRGCFVVVAARTKKIVRELSLRFRERGR
jgi:hypothetical protein